jgi:hypothetical protein
MMGRASNAVCLFVSSCAHCKTGPRWNLEITGWSRAARATSRRLRGGINSYGYADWNPLTYANPAGQAVGAIPQNTSRKRGAPGSFIADTLNFAVDV